HWIGIVFGLGAVISMGYWTTDFLVVQRVISAKDLRAAKLAPIIGAAFKMCVPFIVILPGLLGLAVLPEHLTGEGQALASGGHSYNEVLPIMLARYCGPGLLGLGITALIAGFMSGMAGNVSAFATVWTYDIYRAMIRKDASDDHYVSVGRWCTILGVLVSIGTAYLVMSFLGCQRHGGEHVPRAMVLDRLRAGNRGGKPGHASAARIGADRPGVWLHQNSLRRPPGFIPASHFLGRLSGRGVCGFANHILVGEQCTGKAWFPSGFSSALCCWLTEC